MAAGNFTVYGLAKLAVEQGSINLTTGSTNLFAVLVTSTYTPASTDSTYANISANEAAGTGYTAGGQLLTSVSLTQAAGVVTFTSAAASWPTSTITARYLVIVRRVAAGTAASTDPIVGYVDLTGSGTGLSSTAGTFSVTPNASGWFTLT